MGDVLRQSVISYFDLCTGCRICELACSAVKYGTFAPRKARITVSMGRDGLLVRPIVCEQCENAFCLRACPENAISRDQTTNAVVVDSEKCIGCGLCTKACPIGAIKIDVRARKAVKCDLCGGEPACVKYCPTKALALK